METFSAGGGGVLTSLDFHELCPACPRLMPLYCKKLLFCSDQRYEWDCVLLRLFLSLTSSAALGACAFLQTLAENGITSAGLRTLCGVLMTNKTIRQLDISGKLRTFSPPPPVADPGGGVGGLTPPPFRGWFFFFLLVSIWKFPRTWTLTPPPLRRILAQNPPFRKVRIRSESV